MLPNPALDTEFRLQPLGRSFNPTTRQGGPPQFDVGIAFPVDWLLFGKRAATVAVARTGIDVAGADLLDVVRQRLLASVTAFYGVLEAEELLAVERDDLEGLRTLQSIDRAAGRRRWGRLHRDGPGTRRIPRPGDRGAET